MKPDPAPTNFSALGGVERSSVSKPASGSRPNCPVLGNPKARYRYDILEKLDCGIALLGPEVKSLAGRYLGQMLDELKELPAPDGRQGTLLDNIDVVVPHQANKTMVLELAAASGLAADRLYFNIDKVGNASSASIPLAVADAVRDGVITEPVRVFAPGFGAGAVAGFSVMRIDPAVVAPA